MRRLQLVDTGENRGDSDAGPGDLRIAFATTDRKHVDAHFGSAPYLMIYEIGPDSARFIEAIAFDVVSDEMGGHDAQSDDRIAAKIQALNGCAMLFVYAIGGGAAARVVNSRIYPIKVQTPETFNSVIARTQTMLRGTPPPWLRKLLGRPQTPPDAVLTDADDV